MTLQEYDQDMRKHIPSTGDGQVQAIVVIEQLWSADRIPKLTDPQYSEERRHVSLSQSGPPGVRMAFLGLLETILGFLSRLFVQRLSLLLRLFRSGHLERYESDRSDRAHISLRSRFDAIEVCFTHDEPVSYLRRLLKRCRTARKGMSQLTGVAAGWVNHCFVRELWEMMPVQLRERSFLCALC